MSANDDNAAQTATANSGSVQRVVSRRPRGECHVCGLGVEEGCATGSDGTQICDACWSKLLRELSEKLGREITGRPSANDELSDGPSKNLNP